MSCGEDGSERHFGRKNQQEKGEMAMRCCFASIKLVIVREMGGLEETSGLLALPRGRAELGELAGRVRANV